MSKPATAPATARGLEQAATYLTARGFKLAGGMWGECFWKKLGPHLVASIASEDGTDPPSSLSNHALLRLYVPVPGEEEEEECFTEFESNLAHGLAEAPSNDHFTEASGSVRFLASLAEVFARACAPT